VLGWFGICISVGSIIWAWTERSNGEERGASDDGGGGGGDAGDADHAGNWA